MFERLRELRKEKGLTCEDMAKLLGLGTKAAYSKKELGRTKFTLEDARKISCVFGKDIDDIFLLTRYLFKIHNAMDVRFSHLYCTDIFSRKPTPMRAGGRKEVEKKKAPA